MIACERYKPIIACDRVGLIGSSLRDIQGNVVRS